MMHFIKEGFKKENRGRNMENKKTNGRSPVLVTVICAVLLTFSVTYFIMNMFYFKKYRNYAMLSEIDQYIDKHYYGNEVEESKLIEKALEGYVQGLDDVYSSYRGPVKAEENHDRYAGLTTGIGVSVSQTEDGYLNVAEVYEGSTAKEAGILAGDIIIMLDGKDVAELGIDGAVQYIGAGEQDSVISVKILRGEETIVLDVKRGKIDIISVKGGIVEQGIGYISISKFNEKTPEQFFDVINELTENGAEGFIIDLRNNGGGLVKAVDECIDPYMPEGIIAEAIYKNGQTRTIIDSDAENRDINAVILVNEYSASGAELFAAAFRDFKNIPLVGVTTFGKGIMQNTFDLSDGGSLTLTVARYRTTKSECYHGIGLKPDYEVEYISGTDTDEQYEKAMEVLREKIN